MGEQLREFTKILTLVGLANGGFSYAYLSGWHEKIWPISWGTRSTITDTPPKKPTATIPTEAESTVEEVARLRYPPRRAIASNGVSIEKRTALELPESTDEFSTDISLEVSLIKLISQLNTTARRKSPDVLYSGLRLRRWRGSHSYEASLRTRIGSTAGDSRNSSQPYLAEGRYRRSWLLPGLPVVKEAAISADVGAEYYRSGTRDTFSPGYELLKVGSGIDLQLTRDLSTRGELLVGGDARSSRKIELGGSIRYAVDEGLSIDAGYRAFVFDAGTATQTPTDLPYRESFSEFFSGVRWRY